MCAHNSVANVSAYTLQNVQQATLEQVVLSDVIVLIHLRNVIRRQGDARQDVQTTTQGQRVRLVSHSASLHMSRYYSQSY